MCAPSCFCLGAHCRHSVDMGYTPRRIMEFQLHRFLPPTKSLTSMVYQHGLQAWFNKYGLTNMAKFRYHHIQVHPSTSSPIRSLTHSAPSYLLPLLFPASLQPLLFHASSCRVIPHLTPPPCSPPLLNPPPTHLSTAAPPLTRVYVRLFEAEPFTFGDRL